VFNVDKEQIAEMCLALPGAAEDYQQDWEAWRYRVGNKMFALIGEYQGRSIVSLKCDPLKALELREMYADIFPGYYLNKALWNSTYMDGEVPEQLVAVMIKDSYQLVFNSLTKKLQKELMEAD
jgi:predicted DNA-binding protein (MmcQ/YjbR family)